MPVTCQSDMTIFTFNIAISIFGGKSSYRLVKIYAQIHSPHASSSLTLPRDIIFVRDFQHMFLCKWVKSIINRRLKYYRKISYSSTSWYGVISSNCKYCSYLTVLFGMKICIKSKYKFIGPFSVNYFRQSPSQWASLIGRKVHGANKGSTWGRQDPGGPHSGPMNLAIRGVICLQS